MHPKTPPSQAPSPSDLAAMALDQIQKVVLAQAGGGQEAVGGGEDEPSFYQGTAAAEAPPEPAAASPEMDDMSLMVPPDVVMEGTQAMVESGFLAAPSDTVTPEVLAGLQKMLEAQGAGPVSLTDPIQVREALQNARSSHAGSFQPSPGASPGPRGRLDTRARPGRKPRRTASPRPGASPLPHDPYRRARISSSRPVISQRISEIGIEPAARKRSWNALMSNLSPSCIATSASSFSSSTLPM